MGFATVAWCDTRAQSITSLANTGNAARFTFDGLTFSVSGCMVPAHDKPARLVGIVEADETFILESFKGCRAGLPRASRKRGGKPKKTGLSAEQIPVLVACDRTGATIDGILPKLDKTSVTAVLAGVVIGKSTVL